MKASEIFLHYAAPLYNEIPKDVPAAELQRLLMVPETVWNAINTDKNSSRKPGRPPKILQDQAKNVPVQMRAEFESNIKLWTDRKDKLFSQYQWPMILEVYENVKGEVIIRVKVVEPSDPKKMVGMPAEWIREKSSAEVVQIK
ncbi:MAG: hypothetical protein IPL83_08030 [Bdellovibrionales bacterium]|nr:hypothetical protein [Bdellovibrionales bacterium]